MKTATGAKYSMAFTCSMAYGMRKKNPTPMIRRAPPHTPWNRSRFFFMKKIYPLCLLIGRVIADLYLYKKSRSARVRVFNETPIISTESLYIRGSGFVNSLCTPCPAL
jgi:hypothetical protein